MSQRDALARIALVFVLVLAACSSASSARGERDSDDRPESPTTKTTAAIATTEPASASAYGAGWSAVHADSRNSDYSTVPGASQVELAWQRHLEGNVQLGPIAWTINLGPTSDPRGQLYVTANVPGCHLQAIDVATGETRWCASQVAPQAVVSSPVLDRDGRLFVADGTAMRAFDRDGTELWATPIVGVPLSAQLSPAGNVVFVTHVGVVYLLDRDTGQPVVEPQELVPDPTWTPDQSLWPCARGTEGCPSANTPAVDPASGRLYFTWWEPGHAQAGIRALQLVEGASPAIVDLWTNDALPGGSGASPVLSADGTRLYVTDNVDSMHALDAATGAVIWSEPIGIAAGGSLSVSPDGLILPPGGPLQAFRDDGDRATLVWRAELVNSGIATQASGDRVYATVLRARGELDFVVVDARNGAVLDREPIEGTTRFSVGITVAADGTVLVPTIVGTLVAFRPTV